MCLIVGSALSVNKIGTLFPRMMNNLKLNHNEPVCEEDSVSVLDWPEIAYLAKLLSYNFRSIDRGHDPRPGITNDPICVVCQRIYVNIRIYPKVEDYETENKTRVDTVRMRENSGSLNFNFISLPNPAVDENWVCRHRLQQLILGK